MTWCRSGYLKYVLQYYYYECSHTNYHKYVHNIDIWQAFQNHLEPFFEDDGEQQIVFALQEHEWTIPVIKGTMNDEALADFIAELDLFIGEFIAVLITNELLARVIVFNGEGAEKIYPWYRNQFM